jgi:hypothetical protein
MTLSEVYNMIKERLRLVSGRIKGKYTIEFKTYTFNEDKTMYIGLEDKKKSFFYCLTCIMSDNKLLCFESSCKFKNPDIMIPKNVIVDFTCQVLETALRHLVKVWNDENNL